MAKVYSSFFTRIIGVLGYFGAGWYPGTAAEGVGPFNSVSSDAGVTVDSGTALQLSAVWGCVRLLSETIASLPLELKVPDSNGQLKPAVNSSILRMLSYSPNANMTAVEFWEMMVASLCLWGNAYAKKITVAGRVVSLEPLRPEFMTVFRDENASIKYRYGRYPMQDTYTSDEMFHIKGWGVDGLIGLSPIAVGRQTVGSSVAANQASGSFMKSGLTASGFIEYERSFPTTEQRDDVRKSIESFTGASNTGKVMVLENGMKYNAITINPIDAQLLETRMFNIEEVCRWFRVPPQLIGHTDKSSSWAASLENLILWFVKSGLNPYLTRITQGAKRSFGIPQGSVLRFKFEELLRGDSEARAALWASASQNGWMTREEIREFEGLPSLPGADQLTVQSNLVPLDQLAEMGGQPSVAAPPPKKKPKPKEEEPA